MISHENHSPSEFSRRYLVGRIVAGMIFCACAFETLLAIAEWGFWRLGGHPFLGGGLLLLFIIAVRDPLGRTAEEIGRSLDAGHVWIRRRLRSKRFCLLLDFGPSAGLFALTWLAWSCSNIVVTLLPQRAPEAAASNFSAQALYSCVDWASIGMIVPFLFRQTLKAIYLDVGEDE